MSAKKEILILSLILFISVCSKSVTKSVYGSDMGGGGAPKNVPRPSPAGICHVTASTLRGSKIVTFRTDIDPELDWYKPCDGGDRQIDFPIDVNGVGLCPIKSATLTLAVWDVDYDCDVNACGGCCERDKVYINYQHRLMTPVEYLTGADGQWSTVVFNVDPGWIVDGNNYIQISIDTMCADCWCVACDWGELALELGSGYCYVDANATGGNNGSSWEDAFTNLQDALDAARNCDCNEILVAEGIYKPDQDSVHPNGTGNREATFELINCVAIYGGFPEGGGDWDERKPSVYETILSGDLQGNDTEVSNPEYMMNDPCRAENSYHVVTAEYGVIDTSILDGFTISAGNADGNNPDLHDLVGGGLYSSGNPTLRNCAFKYNAALGSPGPPDGHGGGGIYGINRIVNCLFKNNWCDTIGGGIFCGDSNVINCTFIGNGAGSSGGAISTSGHVQPGVAAITNCIVWDNGEVQIPQIPNNAIVTYSNIQDGWLGEGNIDENPMLEADGLHLMTCSPCIDAGTNTSPGGLEATDIECEERIIDGDCDDEAVVDMGADEYFLEDCDILLRAHCPKPKSNSVVSTIDSLRLAWTEGQLVADINGHRIYFGTDFDEVSNADINTPIIFRRQQNDTTYPLRNLAGDYKLLPNMTYYWRVDEVNDPCVWKGTVWNFTMHNYNYIIVDDFNYSYPCRRNMEAVWTAPVTNYCFPECASNPGGTIALDAGRMRFSYDNRGTIACPWSEAKADYNGIGVDWTAGGLFDFTVLSIGIDGNMYNAVDPEYDRMYVAIEDTAGNFNLVNHPDPNVQRKTCCQEWQIPLADLNDPNVDLTDINALYIGTGPRCSWGPPPYTYGGEGVIYIDNIRLYMKVCQQGYRPAGDLTRDCVVDLYDLKVLCEEWLTEGTVSDIYPKGSRDCFVDFRDFAILADEWIMENY